MNSIHNINGLFQNIGDCCGLYSTYLQSMIADYYYQASYMMFSINDSIYAAEIFGKPTEQLYNTQNDFNYLLLLLIMIHYERERDAYWSSTGFDQGVAYYYEEHNLACIRRNFMCKGYDIITLLRTFVMDPDNPNILNGIAAKASPGGLSL